MVQDAESSYGRNALWMSRELAKAVAETRILLVGCGGTGSVVAITAAGVGFRHFLLVDPDALERTDLNRSPHAGLNDLGHAKVTVLGHALNRISPEIAVDSYVARFPDERVLLKLDEGSTFAVGCVDTIKARLEMDVLLRQRGITLFDVGTGFVLDETDMPRGSGGQVFISRPDGPCLRCLGFDSTAVHNAYPAPPVASSVEPSVVTLNFVVGSVAVDLVLAEVQIAGTDNVARYNRDVHRIDRYRAIGDPRCRVCGAGNRQFA
jgi:molybdopterin/thiamine biosynthesis adenylyltransferase